MKKLSPENIKYMWIILLAGLFFVAGLIGFLLGCIGCGFYYNKLSKSNQNGKLQNNE